MSEQTKTVVIMSGIPGSGKSTAAKRIKREHDQDPATGKALIVSADDYFVSYETGDYEFDPKLLPKAHADCLLRFVRALVNSGRDGIDMVIVDNTNIESWERRNYEAIAGSHGWVVKHHPMEVTTVRDIRACWKLCVHNVPLAVIADMAVRYEPPSGDFYKGVGG